MTDSPSAHDPGVTHDRGSPPRMPRWVKAAVIVVGVLLLLFAVMRITGLGGEHGPGRHKPAGIGLTDQRGEA
ncbi:hypothetical protein [Nonomuraea sp. NPDC049480]|uniref:hypothetical protein n=1 Tax=Nonomuraea sp. NPDC049480 TaxID=3364353 RepID=UPI0037B283BA